MVDRQAVTALRRLQCPPLVHSSTLEAAAQHCSRFGADEEALNAAVLAANILQAHILEAQKANANREPLPEPVFRPRPPLVPEVADEEVSEQAKQAMAAAQATNELLREKQRDKEEREKAAQAEEAAQAAQAVQQPFAPVDPLPLGLPMATAMGQALPFMLQSLQPPLMLQSLQPAVPPAPPPMLAPRPPPVPVVRPVIQMQEQRPPPPAAKLPEPRVDFQMEQPIHDKREEGGSRIGEASSSAAQGGGDVLRCHLHRKPQMTCKICRRLYYSLLDPTALKKDERFKEKAVVDQRGDVDADVLLRRAEAFEITNKQTFNFNSMLRDQILKNTYFKSLMNIDTFEGVVDEMYKYAETAEVYGAGTTTVPSTLFCCLFRLFTIGISQDELQQLLDTRDWPYIRCCGLLYIRFGCAPEKLWDQLGEYCLDDQEFEPSKAQPNFQITIGEYVEALLMDERYYFTALPRIPVGVKKKIEEQCAPLAHFRKRTMANKRNQHLFEEPGTQIEACNAYGLWVSGSVVKLSSAFPTRIMVKVRHHDGHEDYHHLGKVIIVDRRPGDQRGRSRSRSPRRSQRENSPDWTRSRGKTQAEMVQELRTRQRERAVCSSGKDYARKPIGFMSGLALKRDIGVASTRLCAEETYAPRQVEHRKQMTEEEELERRNQERQKEAVDHEKRALMQQVYEKYGTAQQPSKASQQQAGIPGDEEADVLRLG